MGQNKDIGKLFENKLSNGQKNPSKTLWEKIDTSLEVERRRNKKVFYYWFVGSGIALLLGLFIIINKQNLLNKSPKQETNIPLVEQYEVSSEKESNRNSITTSAEEFLNVEDINEEKLSKSEASLKESISEEKKTKDAQTINKSKKKKEKFEDEEYIVSKNYYYYNSKDGKQIITTNKREIDSLILETQKNKDSINPNKQDDNDQ